MWHELGLADVFRGHDRFVTIGENIGRTDCDIPTCGLEWVATRQPVVLAEWPVEKNRGHFTTVGAWRGPFAPVDYRGRTYGLRVHEFRRFVQLPHMTRQTFEVALDIHPDDVKDIKLFERNGWLLVDPKQVAVDPSAYRTYIQRSGAEFAAAKSMYVQTRGGWFSDRSACYLASGKPVLVQDTGLNTFTNVEEAAAGVESIVTDYQRHSRAARDLACEFFDSDRVLGALVDKLAV
jgi:hypothetical protein